MYSGQPGTTDTLLYTAPATGAVIRNIHVANTTSLSATITIGVRSGATLAAANHFLSAFAVPAGGTYDWSGYQVLGNVETIRALQGTTTALTVTIAGIEL
jgi:hypothetical protein